jgi:hypothetical protein
VMKLKPPYTSARTPATISIIATILNGPILLSFQSNNPNLYPEPWPKIPIR